MLGQFAQTMRLKTRSFEVRLCAMHVVHQFQAPNDAYEIRNAGHSVRTPAQTPVSV